jgi:hypothetical protein
MLVHQKAAEGNVTLTDGLLAHYPLPGDIDAWHWAMSLNQADVVGTAIEHLRSLQPHCMGSIVWQLHDWWPGWRGLRFGDSHRQRGDLGFHLLAGRRRRAARGNARPRRARGAPGAGLSHLLPGRARRQPGRRDRRRNRGGHPRRRRVGGRPHRRLGQPDRRRRQRLLDRPRRPRRRDARLRRAMSPPGADRHGARLGGVLPAAEINVPFEKGLRALWPAIDIRRPQASSLEGAALLPALSPRSALRDRVAVSAGTAEGE